MRNDQWRRQLRAMNFEGALCAPAPCRQLADGDWSLISGSPGIHWRIIRANDPGLCWVQPGRADGGPAPRPWTTCSEGHARKGSQLCEISELLISRNQACGTGDRQTSRGGHLVCRRRSRSSGRQAPGLRVPFVVRQRWPGRGVSGGRRAARRRTRQPAPRRRWLRSIGGDHPPIAA